MSSNPYYSWQSFLWRCQGCLYALSNIVYNVVFTCPAYAHGQYLVGFSWMFRTVALFHLTHVSSLKNDSGRNMFCRRMRAQDYLYHCCKALINLTWMNLAHPVPVYAISNIKGAFFNHIEELIHSYSKYLTLFPCKNNLKQGFSPRPKDTEWELSHVISMVLFSQEPNEEYCSYFLIIFRLVRVERLKIVICCYSVLVLR